MFHSSLPLEFLLRAGIPASCPLVCRHDFPDSFRVTYSRHPPSACASKKLVPRCPHLSPTFSIRCTAPFQPGILRTVAALYIARISNQVTLLQAHPKRCLQVTSVDDRFQDKLRIIGEYLQYREVPADLKRRVKRHYTNCWRRSPVPFAEQEVVTSRFASSHCSCELQASISTLLCLQDPNLMCPLFLTFSLSPSLQPYRYVLPFLSIMVLKL